MNGKKLNKWAKNTRSKNSHNTAQLLLKYPCPPRGLFTTKVVSEPKSEILRTSSGVVSFLWLHLEMLHLLSLGRLMSVSLSLASFETCWDNKNKPRAPPMSDLFTGHAHADSQSDTQIGSRQLTRLISNKGNVSVCVPTVWEHVNSCAQWHQKQMFPCGVR